MYNYKTEEQEFLQNKYSLCIIQRTRLPLTSSHQLQPQASNTAGPR